MLKNSMTKFHYYIIIALLSCILALLTEGFVSVAFSLNVIIICFSAFFWAWKNRDLEL